MRLNTYHLGDGELRAYLDHSLVGKDLERVRDHLSVCQHCNTRADELLARAQHVQDTLSILDRGVEIQPEKNLPAALIRLAAQIESEKEKQSMKPSIFSRIPRFAWTALIVIAVMAFAFSFEPVRALASDFLALFRVEQIRVVEFDSDQVSKNFEQSSKLEFFLSEQVQVEEKGTVREVDSAEEASALAGFPLRQLSNFEDQPFFTVQPGASMSFTIDLELIKGILRDLERDDIQLPDNLQGANIQIEIPAGIVSSYGDCNFAENQFDPDQPEASMKAMENCVTFFQSPSPVVSAPPELDLTQIGEAYLQLLGMNAQEAATFAKSVDWTTTFVFPLPRNYARYEQVFIDGTQGTLVFERNYQYGHYTLLWVKDGMIYALTGSGNKDKALEIAASIQ